MVGSQLRCAYEGLRSLSESVDQWIHSPTGADLWIDGIDSIRSTEPDIFQAYADVFTRLANECGVQHLGQDNLSDMLEVFDRFAAMVAQPGDISVWHVLAVGMSAVQAAGGVPDVFAAPGVSIANDTLLMLASPHYRAIRCRGFNRGCRVLVSPVESGLPPFRPDYGVFVTAPPYITHHDPPRIQCACINHDLVHIVLFGDTYLRRMGTERDTATLLLNAEECACAFDLLLVAELSRFGIDFHVFEELKKIESRARLGERRTPDGITEGTPNDGYRGVTLAAAADPSLLPAYHSSLKAAGQLHLATRSPVGQRLLEQTDIPVHIYDWFSTDALRLHALGSERFARRIHDPVFADIVGLLPPEVEDHRNLIRFVDLDWSLERPPLTSPNPDPIARARGLSRNRLCFLVVRVAEISLALRDRNPPAHAAVHAELTHWAMRAISRSIESDACRAESVAELEQELLSDFERVLAKCLPNGPRIPLSVFDDPQLVLDNLDARTVCLLSE